MADRTIYITGGINLATSRLLMKTELEKYGPVELCNMGLRAKLNDPTQAPPVIKFATREGAQKAMAACNAGLVSVVGLIIQASWRSDVDTGKKEQRSGLTLPSRDVMKEVMQQPRRKSESRSRSRHGRSRRDRRRRSRSPRGRGGKAPLALEDDPEYRRSRRRGESRDRPPLALTDRDYQSRSPNPRSSEKGTFTACGAGHILKDFLITDRGMEYICDICNVAFRLSHHLELKMQACVSCDYFVCQKCTDSFHKEMGVLS